MKKVKQKAVVNSRKLKCCMLAAGVGILAVCCVILILSLRIRQFNAQDRFQPVGTPAKADLLEVRAEIGEGWYKAMPEGFAYPAEFAEDSFSEVNDGGENTAYGRTCEFTLINRSPYPICDWELVIPIEEDLYVNKAWNGMIAFSQYGGRNTDTFNTMQADPDAVNIESSQVEELLMFPLAKGDMIVYRPSEEHSESPLSRGGSGERSSSVKIGIIFYTGSAEIDFREAYVVYRFGKTIPDEPLFRPLLALLAAFVLLLLILSVVYIVGKRYLAMQKAADEKAKRELGAALKAAEDANNAKTSFLFNLSHDIRTPMNAIIGFTEMAKKNLDDREKLSDCLEKTQQAGNLLLSLVNSVLEMSRIESGKAELDEQPFTVSESFRNIESTMQELAKKKNIALSFATADISDNLVYADIDRTNRVFINIISNAIKYTPNGGTVQVICEQAGRQDSKYGLYRYTFRDNGIGMSEAFQKNLFEQFARENSAKTAGVQGSGLGLSVAKSFVELMHGTIECQSRQNEGTTFVVTLPFRLRKAEKAVQPSQPLIGNAIDRPERKPGTVKDFSGKKILIVEDNALNREIAVDLLRERNCVVEETDDGNWAVERLKARGPHYYDAILMDIQMPIMNGYEATKKIRELYPDARIPIIALSANAFVEDRTASLEAGMNDHIAKPINSDELFSVLAELL